MTVCTEPSAPREKPTSLGILCEATTTSPLTFTRKLAAMDGIVLVLKDSLACAVAESMSPAMMGSMSAIMEVR